MCSWAATLDADPATPPRAARSWAGGKEAIVASPWVGSACPRSGTGGGGRSPIALPPPPPPAPRNSSLGKPLCSADSSACASWLTSPVESPAPASPAAAGAWSCAAVASSGAALASSGAPAASSDAAPVSAGPAASPLPTGSSCSASGASPAPAVTVGNRRFGPARGRSYTLLLHPPYHHLPPIAATSRPPPPRLGAKRAHPNMRLVGHP